MSVWAQRSIAGPNGTTLLHALPARLSSKTRIERLDEERVEASHNPLHKIDEFLSKWKDRFTVDNSAFLDRYLT